MFSNSFSLATTHSLSLEWTTNIPRKTRFCKMIHALTVSQSRGNAAACHTYWVQIETAYRMSSYLLLGRKAVYVAGDVWQCVSMQGKDLLKKLIQKNPRKRSSAQAALEHPWFTLVLCRTGQSLPLSVSLYFLRGSRATTADDTVNLGKLQHCRSWCINGMQKNGCVFRDIFPLIDLRVCMLPDSVCSFACIRPQWVIASFAEAGPSQLLALAVKLFWWLLCLLFCWGAFFMAFSCECLPYLSGWWQRAAHAFHS